MSVWDSMVQGGNKLPISAFDESNGLYEDFSGGLSGVFGTSGDRESTDGKFGNSFYAQGVNVYWGDSQHQSHAAINDEHQFYRNGFGNDPNPLGNYSLVNGNLKCSARRSTASERSSFAHYKGYHITPSGAQAKKEYFDAGNNAEGFTQPPADWFPVEEPRDDGIYIRFEKYPADFISVMFHTLGRYMQSFGRIECRGKSASGGRVLSNDKNYQQIDAWFAALAWALEAIEFGLDINGEPKSDTDMPANELADGTLPEADAHENFSESPTKAHQTLHYYDGIGGQKQTPSSIISTANATNNFITYGVDITPGKIGFYIGDTYRYVLTTPASIANPKPIYVKDPVEPYKPKLGVNGLAETAGTRKNPDGSDYYMKWFFLSNLAVNSNLVKGLVYDNIKNPDPFFTHEVADWSDTAHNEIEYVLLAPLAVDNPDLYPVKKNGEPVAAGEEPPIVIINPETTQFKKKAQNTTSYTKDNYATFKVTDPDAQPPFIWDYSALSSRASLAGSDDGPELTLKINQDVASKITANDVTVTYEDGT